MNERALQSKVMKMLKQRGGLWVNCSPGPYTPKGIADIIGCFYGQFVAIELKHPKYHFPCDELTPPQRLFMIRVAAAEGYYICASDMDEIELFLDGIEIEHAS